MPHDAIQKKITEIIATQLSLKEKEITPVSHFVDDLGADSLDIVEMIMELENEFGVDIPDEDMQKLSCVQDLTRYLTKLIAK